MGYLVAFVAGLLVGAFSAAVVWLVVIGPMRDEAERKRIEQDRGP